ncbi:MAG: SBBP repeat-containing protein [Pseudomonadota bacterium]
MALPAPVGQGASADVLRMRFAGAGATPKVDGLERLFSQGNYLIGQDKRRWRSRVEQYARVHYDNVYPGVDLVFYGNQRQLEYDFVVASGADPRQIRLDFSGAQEVRVTPGGDLILKTRHGELVQRKPLVYQVERGARKPVAGRYVLRGGQQVGFLVARYDAGKPLVIDPVLSYSTYLGGSADDQARGLGRDAGGNVYVAGFTQSADFPAMPGAFQAASGGGTDAFLARYSPAGAKLNATYYGGSGDDRALGLAMDGSRSVYVAGETRFGNFPVVGAFQTTLRGQSDAFVSKFTDSGTTPSPTPTPPPASSTDDNGGCTLGAGSAFDPTLPSLLLGALLYHWLRRRVRRG